MWPMLEIPGTIYIPKNGKFSHRPIFTVFRGKSHTSQIEKSIIFSKFVPLY